MHSAIESGQCKEGEKIIVSTDSKRYIDLCRGYDCIFHQRSSKTSIDTATTLSVLEESLIFMGCAKMNIELSYWNQQAQ